MENLKHETENNIKSTVVKINIDGTMRAKLREPFPPEALGTIASKTYLTSIKAMYIIERLNNVFGVGRWDYKSEIIKEQDEQVLIRGQLIILDYNCVVPEQYGSHKIKGKGVELADGYKSAITDGITKSASYLEIGIDVFKGKVKPGNNEKMSTGDQLIYIHNLLTTSSISQELKEDTEQKMENFTYKRASECINWLKDNQIESVNPSQKEILIKLEKAIK